MDRLAPALVALIGLALIVMNRKAPDVAMTNSRAIFGREIRAGSREHRFTVIFARSLAIFVGSVMMVGGTLDALWSDWRGVLFK